MGQTGADCSADSASPSALSLPPNCLPVLAAAAPLIMARARGMPTGILPDAVAMRKFIRLRCVCAPHNLSAGTSRGPKVSCSVLVAPSAAAPLAAPRICALFWTKETLLAK